MAWSGKSIRGLTFFLRSPNRAHHHQRDYSQEQIAIDGDIISEVVPTNSIKPLPTLDSSVPLALRSESALAVTGFVTGDIQMPYDEKHIE